MLCTLPTLSLSLALSLPPLTTAWLMFAYGISSLTPKSGIVLEICFHVARNFALGTFNGLIKFTNL